MFADTSTHDDPSTPAAVARRYLAAFATADPEDLVADGDRVAAAYTMHATNDGHPITIRGVMWIAVRDGLVAKRTDYWDSLTFLRQTGKA